MQTAAYKLIKRGREKESEVLCGCWRRKARREGEI
jgi:hypothetical protein